VKTIVNLSSHRGFALGVIKVGLAMRNHGAALINTALQWGVWKERPRLLPFTTV